MVNRMDKIYRIFYIAGIIILSAGIIYKIILNEYDLLFVYGLIGLLCYVGVIKLADIIKNK
jgi:uncharacterized membrane protein YeiB